MELHHRTTAINLTRLFLRVPLLAAAGGWSRRGGVCGPGMSFPLLHAARRNGLAAVSSSGTAIWPVVRPDDMVRRRRTRPPSRVAQQTLHAHLGGVVELTEPGSPVRVAAMRRLNSTTSRRSVS
jgi:hypothetical protein